MGEDKIHGGRLQVVAPRVGRLGKVQNTLGIQHYACLHRTNAGGPAPP